MVDEKVAGFLKTGSDWSRMKTSVPGVFLLKMPPYRSAPARLAVELNPVDNSGTPTKKRGLVIRSSQELEAYKTIFQVDKLEALLMKVEEVNPPVKAAVKPGEDVLQL